MIKLKIATFAHGTDEPLQIQRKSYRTIEGARKAAIGAVTESPLLVGPSRVRHPDKDDFVEGIKGAPIDILFPDLIRTTLEGATAGVQKAFEAFETSTETTSWWEGHLRTVVSVKQGEFRTSIYLDVRKVFDPQHGHTLHRELGMDDTFGGAPQGSRLQPQDALRVRQGAKFLLEVADLAESVRIEIGFNSVDPSEDAG